MSFPQGWNDNALSKLWLYNLHYFNDLNAIGASDRRGWHRFLLTQWVAQNPPSGGQGWEPYPLSLRIVNWIKYALTGDALPPAAVHSLAVQARYLRGSLEYHLLGNHLLANAKALVYAGLFFQGAEAESWLAKGCTLLARELPEQILPDGGHYERSPMYHALVLEDLLDLINLYQAYRQPVPALWEDCAQRMHTWLRVMTHPDGGIAFFNDAAFGVAPSPDELEAYAARLDLIRAASTSGTQWLPESGYARLESGGAVLLADVAPVGPDCQPGHAHADSLSCELSIGGRRVLVNSGTSEYGISTERLRQRGTAAHNTIRLDGADSSEVWSGFRVARRAHVRVEGFAGGSAPRLQAVHDGYRRLSGMPLHRRAWQMQGSELSLMDEITGCGGHHVELFFHFHPDLGIRLDAPHLCVAELAGRPLLQVELDPGLQYALLPDTWHPAFGVTEPSFCLHGEYTGPLPCRFETRLKWALG